MSWHCPWQAVVGVGIIHMCTVSICFRHYTLMGKCHTHCCHTHCRHTHCCMQPGMSLCSDCLAPSLPSYLLPVAKQQKNASYAMYTSHAVHVTSHVVHVTCGTRHMRYTSHAVHVTCGTRHMWYLPLHTVSNEVYLHVHTCKTSLAQPTIAVCWTSMGLLHSSTGSLCQVRVLFYRFSLLPTVTTVQRDFANHIIESKIIY